MGMALLVILWFSDESEKAKLVLHDRKNVTRAFLTEEPEIDGQREAFVEVKKNFHI